MRQRRIIGLAGIALGCMWLACGQAQAQDGDPDTWRLKEPIGGVLDSCQVTATPQHAAFAPVSKVFPASAPPYGFEHPFSITSMIAGIQGAVDLTASCTNTAGEGAPATPAVASFPFIVPGSPSLLE